MGTAFLFPRKSTLWECGPQNPGSMCRWDVPLVEMIHLNQRQTEPFP